MQARYGSGRSRFALAPAEYKAHCFYALLLCILCVTCCGMYKIIRYINENGREPFTEWIAVLRDKKAVLRIIARFEQVQDGNFGDCKPVGSGVWELRIDVGQGYRVYYSIVGKQVILLLAGGDKRSQNRDIEKAINYLDHYKRSKI